MFWFEYTSADEIYTPKLFKVLEKPLHNLPISYFPTEAVSWAFLSSFCHAAPLISVSRGRIAAPHKNR